jgi:Amt family ammonium transporter
VVSIFVWGFVLTYAFLYLVNLISPVRASDAIQKSGLDAEEIGVEAYPEFK